MERSSDFEIPYVEAEVKQPLVPILIDECMSMVFQQQVRNDPALCHEPKQIEVTPEKNMQAHFYMVPVPILPGCHLASHEWPLIIDFHFITPVQQFYCGGEAS
jgi:hypothetical protein